MREDLQTGRSEMKSVIIGILDRMYGELSIRTVAESNEINKGKMKYAETILKALRSNIVNISCFKESD